MPTAIKETTVAELIQELQNLPGDAPVTLKHSDGESFLIVGFEAGTDGVNIIVSDDDGDEDDEEQA